MFAFIPEVCGVRTRQPCSTETEVTGGGEGGGGSSRGRRTDWEERGRKVLEEEEEEDREELLRIVPRLFALQRSAEGDTARRGFLICRFPLFLSAILLSFIFRSATTNRNVVNSGFLSPLPVVQDEV